jgi:hypothetical protein
MKDIFEILRQKEIELVRVRQEVDALRLVIPLLDVVEEQSWHADHLNEADLSTR